MLFNSHKAFVCYKYLVKIFVLFLWQKIMLFSYEMLQCKLHNSDAFSLQNCKISTVEYHLWVYKRYNFTLRTEVSGDFNIHGTKYFRMLNSIKNRKQIWCCKPPVPLVGQTTCPLHEILTWLVITENAWKRHFSNNHPWLRFSTKL